MDRPLRVLAVDDEPLALDRLAALLRDMDEATLVGTASGCRSAKRAIAVHRPDLALLDIRMRDGTAFDLLESIAEGEVPLLAFVTAYPRYAYRAFEVSAIDYLLKPVEPEKLHALFLRAARRRDELDAAARLAELEIILGQLREADGAPEQSSPGHPSYVVDLWVRQHGTDHVRVGVEDIDWITVQDDYACLHARGRELLVRTSLDRLLAMLDPAEFVRIHRTIIVHRDRIARVSLKRIGSREAILRDGTRLPIGRIHARNLDWKGIGRAGG